MNGPIILFSVLTVLAFISVIDILIKQNKELYEKYESMKDKYSELSQKYNEILLQNSNKTS